MKILLLNPPFLPKFSRSSRSPAVTKGGTIYYPYFLAYATGALEKHGFEDTKLVDAVAKNWSHEQTIDFVKSFKPSLVIIDTSTPSIYNDVNVGSRIKEILPNTHITLVGTHPTNLTEETFALSKNIDSICRGEYDLTVVDLAKAIEERKSLKTVDGLSFRSDEKLINNKPRRLMTSKELDELPFVSEVYKKHLNIKDYFYASVMHPEVTILTARGCPYNCLAANTKIMVDKSQKTIKNLIKNPSLNVISYNKGKLVKSSILDTQIFESDELIEIETEDGKKLKLTPDHLIWTKRGWVEAAKLTQNDYLLVSDRNG